MLSSYLTTMRTFGRTVWLYFAVMSLIGFTIDGGIYSVVFNLFVLRLGYGPEFVGQVNSVGLLAFALCSLPSGTLGARLGNRRAMIVGLLTLMLSSLLLAFSEFVPAPWQESWLILFYMGYHSSIAIFFVNTAPFLMATTHESQRSHAFALQSAMISSAAFAGSLIGGVLPGFFARSLGMSLDAATPYRYPLLLAGAMIVIGIGLLYWAKEAAEPAVAGAPPPLPPRRTYPSLFRVPRFGRFSWQNFDRPFVILLVVISLVRLFQIAGMAVLSTFFNVYMDNGLGAPTAQVGLITGLGRLLAVPIVLTMPMLSARWGHRHLVTISSLSAVFFLLPLALIPQWWAAGLGYMGIMAGSSIRYTSFMVFIMAKIKPEQRSFMSGLSEMTAGLSFAVMALLGGYIIVNQGYQTLFLVGAGATLVGTLLFWGYFRERPAPPVTEVSATGG
ncbi:MAG: MFS transporter [Caldilineaceae bacterium]|nr:MFS transporter [Caldilineaceae bacterium]